MTDTVKYEIVIDNEDREGAPETPWTANMRLVVDDHTQHHPRRIQLGAPGVGENPREALVDLVIELEDVFAGGDHADPCPVNAEQDDRIAHQVSDGSCDRCGAKNFN